MNTTLMRIVAVSLSTSLVVTGTRAADDPKTARVRADTAEIQGQLEAATKTYAHFATSDIIANYPTDREWPTTLITEQAMLLADLETWAQMPESLHALVGHRDPKVRTLVLGALFVREDPHDLPLIASLVADQSPTFPHAHHSLNAAGFTGDLTEILAPQTIGQVAQAMVFFYRQAAPLRDDCKFDEYWRARSGRQTCASWFLVRINRATRNISPPQPKYQRDVQRVVAEIKDLPLAERAWTQVFLRCKSSTELNETLTDATCIADLKTLGPDEMIRFLERRRVTDDPDLWFDDLERESTRVHSFMAHFILRRAGQLLRVQDVPALLAREEFERKTPQTLNGISPYWAAAAAELTGDGDPAAATQIIDAALGRFPISNILGGRHQAVLIGSLWRINGMKEQQRIVDWFYRAQARVTEAKSDESNHGPVDFLRSVHKANRADTKELMVALVADARLNQTDWAAMKELLEIASDGLPEPLVSHREIFSVWPPRDEHEKKALAEWREKLIRRYRS